MLKLNEFIVYLQSFKKQNKKQLIINAFYLLKEHSYLLENKWNEIDFKEKYNLYSYEYYEDLKISFKNKLKLSFECFV